MATRSRVSTPAKAAARKPAPARAATAPKAAATGKPAGAKKELRAIFARPQKDKPVAPGATASKPKQDPSPRAAKKLKLVRDSFTFPKTEYAALEQLKKRAHALGRQAKKSELVRAGLTAIAVLGDAAFVAAIDIVPRIKSARTKDAKVDA